MATQSETLESHCSRIPAAIKDNTLQVGNITGMIYLPFTHTPLYPNATPVIPRAENLHAALDQTHQQLDHCVKAYEEHANRQVSVPIAQELHNAVTEIMMELSRHGGVHQSSITRFWFTQVTLLLSLWDPRPLFSSVDRLQNSPSSPKKSPLSNPSFPSLV